MTAAIRLSQQHSCSLNHLVGDREQPRWKAQAERLGRLEIDYQLEPGELQDRQVCGLLAFEYATGIDALLAIGFRQTGAVAHQAAGVRELTPFVDCRNGVARG